MTYAEYLKSQGATDDDIKVIDTAVGRKAFEKLQSDLAAANAGWNKEKETLSAYETRVNGWYEENNGKLIEARNRLSTTEADAARYRTHLLSLHRQGMVTLAKDMGFTDEELRTGAPAAPVTPAPNNPTGFDPEKYFTREDILKIAQSEGDAIAIAQDIAAEHSVLFPGTPLRFRELRQRAVAAKKPVEQVWMEEFKVADARAAREKKLKDDHDNEIRLAERKLVEEEFARKYSSNPDMRVPTESSSPFVPRPAGNPRAGKQPWETGADALAADRVQRGTQTVLKTDFSKIPQRVM